MPIRRVRRPARRQRYAAAVFDCMLARTFVAIPKNTQSARRVEPSQGAADPCLRPLERQFRGASSQAHVVTQKSKQEERRKIFITLTFCFPVQQTNGVSLPF